MGIRTGSAACLLKALLQKKPSGQDDIHKKYWTKKPHYIHGGTNTANKTATLSFLSKRIWSKMDTVPVKQDAFIFLTANEEKAKDLEKKPAFT